MIPIIKVKCEVNLDRCEQDGWRKIGGKWHCRKCFGQLLTMLEKLKDVDGEEDGNKLITVDQLIEKAKKLKKEN